GRRRRRINCRVRLCLVCRGRRGIHYCRVGFFLFPSRWIHCLGFLFASCEQRRGPSENANVFLHKVIGENPMWVTSYSEQPGASDLPPMQCSPAERTECI